MVRRRRPLDDPRSTGGSTVVAPVGITYRLYNTRGTLLDVTDDGHPVATLAYDPGNATWGFQRQVRHR